MLRNRLLSIVLTIFLLCPMIVSCGGETLNDVPAMTLLTELLALFDSDGNVDIYDSHAGEEDEHYLDPDLAGQIFLGEYGAALAEDGMIVEYAHAIPSALYAFEIDIFRVSDEAAGDTVEALLQERYAIKAALKSQIEHYLGTDPNSANELAALEDMEIYRVGNYVMLLATHENNLVKNKIAALLGAKTTDTDAADDTAADTVSDHTVTETTAAAADTSADPVLQAAEDGFTLTVTAHSAPDRIVLGGTCAAGAKIHVTGGLQEQVFGTDYTSWLVEVEIAASGESLLVLTQELDGEMSASISVEAAYDPSVDFSDHGIYQAFMGDNFQGHFYQQLGDWMGTNLLNETELEKVCGAMYQKMHYLEKQGIALIYVIVPNQAFIYPETIPDRYEKSTADTTLLDQFTAIAKENGAVVLDLYPIMEEHVHDAFKIFHKTDSHWTDYGAYWGYYALMQEIAKDYPDAAPLEIDGNLRFYTKAVEAGDMMTHFEIPNALISETATFAEWLVDYPNRPQIYVENRNEIDNHLVADAQTVVNPNAEGKNLPTAMIIRDSFSFNAFAYLNQSFSEIHWCDTWDYRFNKLDIKKAKPNYLIYLVSEKSLESILY